ncbi:unnamed protein product [Rotaria sordida]|uniref:Uncharacterized protein n=1 Tax=Rotaria sordida TaxID=392033 RepID=A0A815MDR6_9BILA|nr:unnamed protein product [Rotaria sordida]
MPSDGELDRNTIFEKFASIKRMHDEVGRKQTEDYQKRLQKLKEEEEESTNRSSSHYHHQDSYDHEWNIDDDFQPLNITDNEVLDESISNRLTNDDEPDDSYITAYQQLIQTQQQQMVAQQEQENMLSTIFEASCEDA